MKQRSALLSPISIVKQKMKQRSVKPVLLSPIPREMKQRSVKSARFSPSFTIASPQHPCRKAKNLALTPLVQSPQSPKKSTKIEQVKELVSSRIDSIKRDIELSHSGILREMEASKSRISKRIKVHTQTCLQVMDEAEKEHRKVSQRIEENMEFMKTSYAEFITEAQAAASRVSKVSIPEITQTMEKAIEGLRSRYGLLTEAM